MNVMTELAPRKTKFDIGDRVMVSRSILPGENSPIRGGDTGTVRAANISLSFQDAFFKGVPIQRVNYVVAIDQLGSGKATVSEEELDPYTEQPGALVAVVVRSRLAATLMAMDVSSMSPVTALTKLYELKLIAQEEANR
jgi:hypothetical protein